VIVGSCLVLSSALGPAVAALAVESLGYRALFAALGALGAIATTILIYFVPESLTRHDELLDGRVIDLMATTSDLSTVS
jgi:predicted MFS family arabinose efflux permease